MSSSPHQLLRAGQTQISEKAIAIALGAGKPLDEAVWSTDGGEDAQEFVLTLKRQWKLLSKVFTRAEIEKFGAGNEGPATIRRIERMVARL